MSDVVGEHYIGNEVQLVLMLNRVVCYHLRSSYHSERIIYYHYIQLNRILFILAKNNTI